MPFDELKPSLDAAYKKIGSQIRIPGFRPGKVPARIIDQRVGRAAVLEEAVNEALPRHYIEAVREHERASRSASPRSRSPTSTTVTSLSFTAEVDIRPEIALPELDGIAVTVDDVEVTDADVDEQLDALRERFGSLNGVERAVETGDYVSLDLVATVDGEEIEGGSANGLSYEVGAGNLIDGLDDAIIGKSAGDTVTFPTTLRQGEQAGEQAEITATVNSVKERNCPSVDDEFAQLASEFDTIDELRADLREPHRPRQAAGQGARPATSCSSTWSSRSSSRFRSRR